MVAHAANIAETSAWLRAKLNVKLLDAIQVASALSVNADSPVIHDRDFAKVNGPRVLG